MKKVLITGANSYIGTSFERYVELQQLDIEVSTLDLLNPKWEAFDFSSFDSIFHVAAIVHKNEKNIPYSLYDDVNVILPFKVAEKAKKQGVPHFIFLSSMSIFGVDSGRISSSTAIMPTTKYGKSKYEAEEKLTLLQDNDFSVAILRPPMVYGPHCSGNYKKLSKLVKKISIFPKITNKRSMIYIDHLCCFIVKIVEEHKSGYFHPQNNNYISTSNMVRLIAKYNKKTMIFIPIPDFFLGVLKKNKIFSKLFSDLYYDFTSDGEPVYNTYNLEETIFLSETLNSNNV